MGWYDAFRGNTARVNLSQMGDDTGSAAKNFGDAFDKIGARMYDTEVDREKEELRELQKQNTQLAIDKTQDEMQTKKFDDAFSTGYQSFENKDEWDQFKSVATTTKDGQILPLYEPSSEAVKQENQFFQTKFNDEAVSESVKGGYDGFDAYKQANPSLIQNADGATLGKIEQYFASKNNKAAEIDAKTKDLKHQERINDLKLKAQKAELKAMDKNTKDDAPAMSRYVRGKTATAFDKNGEPIQDEYTMAQNNFIETNMRSLLSSGEANNWTNAFDISADMWAQTRKELDAEDAARKEQEKIEAEKKKRDESWVPKALQDIPSPEEETIQVNKAKYDALLYGDN